VDFAAGGAALRAAVELVGSCGGGHVIMFHASLPNMGIGALQHRDELKMQLSKQEVAGAEGGLFAPQQPAFFEGIVTDGLLKGVAVSTVCAPAAGAYIDMASLSVLPRCTGGAICYLPGFDPARDGERLHYDISRLVVQPCVYSCVLKLRCSKGLQVESMYGTWEPEVIDPSTFQVSRLSVDGTVNFTVTHTERIEGRKHVYMQIACLHTTRQGHRYIRIHTLQLPVTTSLSNIFRYTEIDAVTNLLLKQAVSTVLSGNGDFKDKIVRSCVNMLHAYRVNCASMTSAGQLILPESLKLLPLYVGSIRKMAAFRSGSDIRADDRITALIHMLGLPMALTGPLVYPRIFPLWPLTDMAGIPTGIDDNVHLPATIACSVAKLCADRMYLLDNGTSLRLCIRPELPPEVLQTVFQVDSLADVAPALAQPFETATLGMQRVLAVVQQIRRERSRLPWQPLTVVLPGTPDEPRLLAAVCEDRVGSEMNYVDFLCHIHKLVQNKQE